MLNELKKALHEHEYSSFEDTAILESMTDVKDVFLDDPNILLVGAEDDPEIRRLVEGIPGYSDDNDTETKRDIEALTESIGGTATLEAPSSTDELKRHISRLEITNSKLRSQAKLYRERGNTFQLQNVMKQIKVNETQIDSLRDKLIKSK